MNKKLEKTLKVVSLLAVGVSIGMIVSEILQKIKECQDVEPDFSDFEEEGFDDNLNEESAPTE